MTEINDITEINDMRDKKEFKSKSFSNYKLTEVRNQLISTIKTDNIIDSFYWLFELFFSGHFNMNMKNILQLRILQINNEKISECL